MFSEIRARAEHPYAWIWESLEALPSFELRTMFGAKAVYLGGRLQLCFMAKKEPWCGILVCTEKAHQPSLTEEIPSLRPHSILPKWLYLPESCAGFESTAARLISLVRQRDSRIGIVAKPKRARRK
ncbi:MAG TPA: hypothetical protein VFG14_17395 [Chthoniobacteraceae bacterium]|nr:hypothetical protein [Chthoniobacteraceae bacterium]